MISVTENMNDVSGGYHDLPTSAIGTRAQNWANSLIDFYVSLTYVDEAQPSMLFKSE